ncbi:hypothetical protein SDJN03_17783, partial [Cucurbita argyrosperma subsp. sororia]
MKIAGLFAAAAASASTIVLSAPPSSAGLHKTTFSHQEKVNRDEEISPSRRSPPSTAPDHFAPRFDGLRFIETLVTAHR